MSSSHGRDSKPGTGVVGETELLDSCVLKSDSERNGCLLEYFNPGPSQNI